MAVEMPNGRGIFLAVGVQESKCDFHIFIRENVDVVWNQKNGSP